MTSPPMARAVLLVSVLLSGSGSGLGPVEARRNASLVPRTFLFSSGHVTDEPIDLLDVLYGDGVDDVRRRPDGVLASNVSSPGVSEAALLFLTGGVSTVFMPSFYLLVFLLSVPVNAAAVLAFARGIRPKKPAAIYMLNLAAADLVFALLLPFKVVYHFGGNDWRFGAALCRVVTAAFYWNAYCSVLLIACVAVDRLLAVVYPVQSLAWRKPRTAAAACTAAWALSLAGAAPLVSSEQTLYLPQLNVTTCHDVQPERHAAWLRVYFLSLCSALFFLPLVVTAASYARVVWSLSAVPAGLPGRGGRRRRAVAMALSVLLIFLLCFLPTNVLMAAHYLTLGQEVAPDGLYAAYLLFLCVGSVNCVLDPLLYAFGSSQCQRRLGAALRCRTLPQGTGSSPSSSRNALRPAHRHAYNATTTSSISSSDASRQYRKLLL